MARTYSQKPAAIKQRMRKVEKKLDRSREDLATLFPDQKPVEEWDFEELQAGRPRNPETGKINRRAKRPLWITPVMLVEAQKRLREVSATELGQYTSKAIAVMVDLMEFSKRDNVRFEAAKYVLDQIMGVATQRVEVTAEVNVSSFLADVMENPDGTQVNVTDGEVLEIEWDEDDEDDDGE